MHPKLPIRPILQIRRAQKVRKVHKVFRANNVSKILNKVPEEQREDTINSLIYEAEVQLQDCIGEIASLQHNLVELQHDLILAQARLACYLEQILFNFENFTNAASELHLLLYNKQERPLRTMEQVNLRIQHLEAKISKIKTYKSSTSSLAC
ncbi:hypothetical protein CDL12_00408 [Handroanthus impetiginosus]|uniref:LOB domain-containing protein n=1 Tax=Handroanthus impetiginosus TaxID=429701 RepID=A0A2G9IAP2_9LAMI|nr:hypothetical protein CDL12_00408 [Handroanthus impetiginosus]